MLLTVMLFFYPPWYFCFPCRIGRLGVLVAYRAGYGFRRIPISAIFCSVWKGTCANFKWHAIKISVDFFTVGLMAIIWSSFMWYGYTCGVSLVIGLSRSTIGTIESWNLCCRYLGELVIVAGTMTLWRKLC